MISNIINSLVSPKEVFGSFSPTSGKSYSEILVVILAVITSYIILYWQIDPSDIKKLIIEDSIDQNSSIDEIRIVSDVADNIVNFVGIFTGLSQALILFLKIIFITTCLYIFVKKLRWKGETSFRQFLSVVITAHMPYLIYSLGLIGISVLAGDGQLSVDTPEYSNIGHLFLSSDISFYSWIGLISIFDFWVVSLLVIFLSEYFLKSILKCILISLFPFILIYTMMFFF